jgi:hypothetical protein
MTVADLQVEPLRVEPGAVLVVRLPKGADGFSAMREVSKLTEKGQPFEQVTVLVLPEDWKLGPVTPAEKKRLLEALNETQ